MAKNSNSGIPGQETLQDAILGLLTRICTAYGHTFSWYTSKQGRVWLSFKGFKPTVYGTSVELPPHFSDKASLDALEVLLATHLPKLFQETPPINSWLNLRSVTEARPQAREYCGALYARYLAGESLIPDDYPASPYDHNPEEGDV